MEKERIEKIKEIFLSGFVAVCVALICIHWFNSFSDQDNGNPYFYRGTPVRSASYYATQTAMVESVKSGAETPTPEHRRTHEATTLSAAPIFTPIPSATPISTITPESDN